MRKVKDEYKWDVRRVIDVVRGMIVYQTEAEVQRGVCDFYNWLPKTQGDIKCTIVQDKNRFVGRNQEYKDFTLTLQCKFGGESKDERPFKWELQFHRCKMLVAKQGSH